VLWVWPDPLGLAPDPLRVPALEAAGGTHRSSDGRRPAGDVMAQIWVACQREGMPHIRPPPT